MNDEYNIIIVDVKNVLIDVTRLGVSSYVRKTANK